MASQQDFLRLLRDFNYAITRQDWQQAAADCARYWQQLTPRQQDAVASKDRLAAVWRAAWEAAQAGEKKDAL